MHSKAKERLQGFYWTFQLSPFMNFKLLENEFGAMQDTCHKNEVGLSQSQLF